MTPIFNPITPAKSSPFSDDFFFWPIERITLEALFIFRYYIWMKTASQQLNIGSDKHWLVMNEQGERFGPVSFETLKLWAKDGRLAPTNTASEDDKVWKTVTQIADLEMDWVAEVSPGSFYGPIHKEAMEALKKEGAIPADAMTFQRSRTDRLASTTQLVTAPVSESPPPKQEELGAVQALERQLDLERKRAQETLQKLQQVEIHVATSEARSEASEKLHKHYVTQAEQVQQQLATQLDQTNKQLADIHAQLLAREQELHQSEQQLASFERIETLLKDQMAQLASQQQELKTAITATQESASPDTRTIEAVIKDALAQLASQQQELKAALAVTQGSANLSAERVELAMKDALAQLASQQQEFKTVSTTTPESASSDVGTAKAVVKDVLAQLASQQQELKTAIAATQGGASLSAERVELLVKDALAQLTRQQQELKTAIAATHEDANLSAGRVENLVKDSMAQLTSPEQNKPIEILFEKLSALLTTAFNTSQAQLFSDLSLALQAEGKQICDNVNKHQSENKDQLLQQIIHLLTQETPPLLEQLTQQGQALQKLSEELKAIGAQVAEVIIPNVSEVIDKDRAETIQRISTKLEEGRENLFGRTQTALSQWHEQLIHANGESQRLAIEYIVRELTTVMNQATQAGREQFLQSVNGGWSDLKQQAASLESQIKQLADAQQKLSHELKTTLEKQLATPPPPVVTRTYVEAEAVEVIPPERPHKKSKPAHETSEPSHTPKEDDSAGSKAGISMADIEHQARRELERLGAQGMNIFKRKK
jgi:myosin heavy subunit